MVSCKLQGRIYAKVSYRLGKKAGQKLTIIIFIDERDPIIHQGANETDERHMGRPGGKSF